MWEWFTTKPFADAKECRFVSYQRALTIYPPPPHIHQIGSVPTPWPSWLIAAQPKTDAEELKAFLSKLSTYVASFDSAESRASRNVEFIKSKFGYPEEDIQVSSERE